LRREVSEKEYAVWYRNHLWKKRGDNIGDRKTP